MKIYVWNTREYFTCQFHRKSVYYNITCISLSAIQVSGLSLRAGGRGFSPATKRVAPATFIGK